MNSPTALLYVADSELAQNLRKATMSKLDYAHPGQCLYAHWINCIIDSKTIIRRNGLSPMIKRLDATKEILPGLGVIVEHFNAQDKADTKHDCAMIAKNMFGSKAMFVSSVNGRVLETIKFYSNPRSMLVLLKLFHAYAIKKIKRCGTPFLAGGAYHGCKTVGDYPRDSLWLKYDDNKKTPRKVKDFKDFALVSNKLFLRPQAMAAYLFKFVSETASELEPVQILKRDVVAWKGTNKGPYIEVKDVYGGEGGAGEGGGGGTSNKRLTKQAFAKPMEKLATSLESLHEALRTNNYATARERLMDGVNTQFIEIAEIVGYTARPSYSPSHDSDHDDTSINEGESSDMSDTDNGSNKSRGDKSIGSVEYSESRNSDSGDDDASGTNKRGEKDQEDSDSNSNSTGSRRNEDKEEVPAAAKQPSDKTDTDNGSKKSRVDKSNESSETNESGNSESEDDYTRGTNKRGEKDQDDSDSNSAKKRTRDDIHQLVEDMKRGGNDISNAKMSGKQIKEALGLAATPKPSTKDKQYFYVIRSSRMDDINKMYTSLQDDSTDTPCHGDNEWIAEFAKELKTLKEEQWHNSIDDLPERRTLPGKSLLLLWNLDEGFTQTFYSQRKSQRASPRRSGSKPQSSTTTKPDAKAVYPATNLNSDFSS